MIQGKIGEKEDKKFKLVSPGLLKKLVKEMVETQTHYQNSGLIWYKGKGYQIEVEIKKERGRENDASKRNQRGN